MIATSSRGSENGGGAFESTSPFKATKKGATTQDGLNGQLQYANDVFKDAAHL